MNKCELVDIIKLINNNNNKLLTENTNLKDEINKLNSHIFDLNRSINSNSYVYYEYIEEVYITDNGNKIYVIEPY